VDSFVDLPYLPAGREEMFYFVALTIVFRVDYYWERCWMLQDMDHMEASCVFYFKVGTLDQLKQSKF